MKKVFFIAGIALLTLASCSKDWTCKCTQTGTSGTVIGSTSTTVTGKKNDVKASCDEGDATGFGYTFDCEIQ
jgi:hypothetical protein